MGEAKASTVFHVGDRIVDAWGRDAEEPVDETKAIADMTGKELSAEIARRNADRAEEDKIVLEDNKKATAIAALEADDEAHAEEE